MTDPDEQARGRAAGDERLTKLRRDYARRMAGIAGIRDERVEQVFAAVPRERFLPAGPWTILDHEFGAVGVSGGDPAPLYDDVLIALDRHRGLNNGSPALHALMLHALGVAPGDRVLHIGAGGGYYTAILAELAGPGGHVTAVEYETHLAELAREALRDYPNVTVSAGDGAQWPREAVQRIYVNCAVADIPEPWLDHLRVGGVLELPLGGPAPAAEGAERRHSARAAVLVITRADSGFSVRYLVPCSFICADGPLAGSRDLQDRLFAAFGRGGAERVRSLVRGADAPPNCWFQAPRWSLSFDPPPANSGPDQHQ